MKDKIDRLIRILNSDGGFFVVAIHSFIEHYMRHNFPDYDNSWTITFNTNLYNYKKYLIQKNPGFFLNELSSFKTIMDQNKLVQSVRHDFYEISPEEVRATTFNFIQFCKAVLIPEEILNDLKQILTSWDRSQPNTVDLMELEKIKKELFRLRKENGLLLDQYKEFEEVKTVKKYLESRIETLSLKIELEKKKSKETTSKLTELREYLVDLNGEKKNIEQKINQYDNIDNYLKHLLRVSLYTRTRMDYERSLTELSNEQKDVLKEISLKSDFLIKGGAGTGKTLVLLEAMKDANVGLFDFASKKLLLITYTNTLVKYDRYISEIMEISNGDAIIHTSDSYLNNIFESKFPQYTIDYVILNSLCSQYQTKIFADDKELRLELEDFIYGNCISREEYVDQMISRKGMKSKLSKDQREEIWNLKNTIEQKMIESNKISKAFSRTMLSKLDLEENCEYDHIFIDESQDLYPIELQLFKKLSKSSLVLAGDIDQSIYGIGSPYKRANISTSGTTRILKTNFRNTIPIHDLAEKFRKAGQKGYDSNISPLAFRDGPIPELYQSEHTEDLYDLLIGKIKIFLNTIEYDRENISILAPSGKILNKIKEKLHDEGIESVNIKDPQFSFKSQGSIRLSPLHSSKGLDIPVVLLFIPILFYNRELESEESQALVRNLIYVSMTRAMENLNVFTKLQSGDPLLEELSQFMSN